MDKLNTLLYRAYACSSVLKEAKGKEINCGTGKKRKRQQTACPRLALTRPVRANNSLKCTPDAYYRALAVAFADRPGFCNEATFCQRALLALGVAGAATDGDVAVSVATDAGDSARSQRGRSMPRRSTTALISRKKAKK